MLLEAYRHMGMIAGKWTLEIKEIEGYFLLVPTSYTKASKQDIRAKTSGCGPGKIGDWFVPDELFGESIYLACQIHDWMYGEGETSDDKKIADRVFLWNMTVLIQELPYVWQTDRKKFDLIRLMGVMNYYIAVYYGGKKAFDKGETMKGIAYEQKI